MFAVALGSDVFVGGLNKFGPQKAFKIKQEIDNLDYNAEKQQHIISSIIGYKTNTRIDKASLSCYTQAILYEQTCDGYMYGYYVPTKLDTYVKEFKFNETTTIEDGVAFKKCPGLNNNNDSVHNFIPSSEGEFLCYKCNNICCPYCIYDVKSNPIICIQCKSISLSTSLLPTEAVMRQQLTESGTNVPAVATYIDVVDIYEDSKESGALSLHRATDYTSVKFPIEPSSIFHVSQNKLHDVVPPKTMKDISHFIHDDDIQSSCKVKLISIIALFVDLSPLSSNEKKIGDYWRSLIPKLVLHIANNSRMHQGERLCKRAIRHAMDKASPSMLESTVSLSTYGNNNNTNNNNSSSNNVVIRIKKKVKPSMKVSLYNTHVCFDIDSLIACSCTCKAGCRTKSLNRLGTERNFCTHGASILMGLSLLLFDGLAEHLLVELRARLSSDDELGPLLDRNHIFLLMTACGRKNTDLLLLENRPTIFECLKEFSVGTDLSKSCGRIEARTTARVLCLLRSFKLKNPLTEFAKIITSGTKRQRTTNESESRNSRSRIRTTTNINYCLHRGLWPLVLERCYRKSSLNITDVINRARADTIQERKATAIYDLLHKYWYKILFPNITTIISHRLRHSSYRSITSYSFT